MNSDFGDSSDKDPVWIGSEDAQPRLRIPSRAKESELHLI